MRFTPHYMVSYKGEFHKAGKPFDIDSADAEEMRKHGIVEKATEKPVIQFEKQILDNTNTKEDVPEKPAKRGGRPRKTD